MITPSFGLTATERVLPRLALDFTTASLDPRVTFTRTGNTATVVNSSGYVAPINADLPRFDYNPTTLACNGLLIEEARTNLFTYSEDFSNPSWVKSNVTVTADAITSPSNLLNADKIVEAATTGSHFFEKVVSLTSGTSYTWSGFFKAGERPSVSLIVFTNVNHTATFNLSTGTAVAPSNATSTITNFGNGWYRCSITFTSGATGNGFFDTYINNGSTTSYVGNGTSGIFAWGAQLETGAFGTSYIPTVASQVTRTADVATMTGTNFSSWFNASEGAFVVKSQKSFNRATSFPRVLAVKNSAIANNSIALLWNESTSVLFGSVTTGGVLQANLGSSVLTQTNVNTIAFGYKNSSFASVSNGLTVFANTSGTVPALDNLIFMCSTTNTDVASGWISKFYYYPQRLTNSELQAFSK
jgi:hypothetical protein